MTNDEIRRHDEIRMTKRATQRFSIFRLRISFDIRHSSFGCLYKSGSCSQCTRKKRKRTFHEPPVWSPGFSRSGPPEGGTPNQLRPPDRFMVPMHAEKTKGGFP